MGDDPGAWGRSFWNNLVRPRTKYALITVALVAVAGLSFLARDIATSFSPTPTGGSDHPLEMAFRPPCELDESKFCRVEIFFATDRKPTGESQPTKYFGGERNEVDEPLTFGTLSVSIPAGHKTGHVEEPLPFFKPDVNRDLVVFDL